jgi:hypothetical protein
MAGAKQASKSNTKAIMTDAAIKASTGKDWMTWFAALDKAGAAKLDHKAIVAMAREMGSGRWYGQMVAVSYERARGLRAMNQKCDGEFSVSVTRVMAAPLAKLYATATADPTGWFPKGKFEETSRTKDNIGAANGKAGAWKWAFMPKALVKPRSRCNPTSLPPRTWWKRSALCGKRR